MKLKRLDGSVWSAEDYSDSFSRSSIDMVLGMLTGEEEVLVGSAESICLLVLLQLGQFPEGLILGKKPAQYGNMILDSEIPHSWFSVEMDRETGKWAWSIETGESALYDIHLSGLRTAREMSKLRHDLVAMSMGVARTDVKIGAIFQNEEVDEDVVNFTPDIHVRIGNCNFIIEIGTTTSSDFKGGNDYFEEKYRKYKYVLEGVKHLDPCVLIIMVVGKSFCICNHVLDNEMIEQLIYHVQIGNKMAEMVDASGMELIMTPTDSEKEHLTQQLRNVINSIKVEEDESKFSSVLDIDRAFIQRLEEPPDVDLVATYYHRSANAAAEEIILSSKKEITEGRDPRVEKYLEILKSQESRDSLKPCCGFPMVSIKREKTFNAEVRSMVIGGEDKEKPIIKLWNGAFKGYKNYDYDFAAKLERNSRRAVCTDPKEQEKIEAENKEFRNQAHRCMITDILTEKERESLALDGLWGKRFKDSEAKKFKEAFSKRPFSLKTDTEDITNFLSNSELLEPCETGEIKLETIELLRDSMVKLGQKTTTLEWVRDWTNTKYFSCLEFISDAALEVAISMKQNVSYNQIILKKLAYYNAYLMILPTKSSEHIFFSIYIPPSATVEVLVSLPFRELHELKEGGYYTDFWSMRADTLANPSTISSTFIGLMSYWAYHYRLDEFTPEAFKGNLNALIMLNFSVLVRLENKAKTEEAITLSRYMYMEILKGKTFIRPDPFRLICKFNTCPRSRLELFVIKRLILAFERMLVRMPKKVLPPTDDGLEDDGEEEVRNNDVWECLVNPYTMGYEDTASRVVNLYYVGFVVDKDKIAQTNSDYATIQKAIKKDREFDIDESDRSNGRKDDFEGFPKEKQFSLNALKHGVALMALDLRKKYGPRFKDKIGELIIEAMCAKMTEEVATLKASSTEECKAWEDLDTAQDSVTNKKYRTKVIVALFKKLELFENNVFKNFDKLISMIEESSRGIISDLFKKNQHSGLREIYVLNIEGRVIALYLETSARVLCKCFPCETMTHPNMKIEVIENHKIQSAKKAHATNRDYSEFHCSSDKKSWNNNLVMPALSVALLSLMPESMHGSVQRCLNMWNKRLLKVPEGVLKLLIDGTVLSCGTYKEMLDEYDNPKPMEVKGQRPPIFAAPKSAFVRLTTGMMQGILHYTSSLTHVAFLYSSTDIMTGFLEVHCPGSEIVISQMCSSDDSSLTLTVLHPLGASDELKVSNQLWGEIACQALTRFCSFYCFTNSEKSVMGAPNHIEFNSEFVIGNTVSVPVLKWTLACYGLSESESFLQRYNTFYNLLSQANAAGLPARNTTMVQISQGMFAYKLIGSSTSPHFTKYFHLIKLYPDPTLGYFIIDNIYVPGMLGFGFYHWATSRQHCLYNIKIKSIIEGTLGFTPEGGLIENFLLRHGRSERYLKMMEDIGEGQTINELREYINSRAECLYRPSRCTEDARVKLIEKSLLPGTANSLSKGNPFLQALQSSVYCLHTFCFTKYESCLIGTEKERTSSKMSLLGELMQRVESISKPPGPILECSEAAAFPNHERYEAYLAVLKPFEKARLKKVRPMRYKKTAMFLPHATSHISVPLYDICRYKWVGVQHRHSIMLANKDWLQYQELMPWLCETLDETLDKSPFSDHMELHNFVSTAKKSYRKFARTGPSIRSTFPESQISQVARRTHQEGYVLALGKGDRNYHLSFRNRRTAMSLALEIPNEGSRNIAIETTLTDYPVLLEELVHMGDKNRREAMLNIIMAKMSGTKDSEITRMIMELGGGLLMTWASEQKKNCFHRGVL